MRRLLIPLLCVWPLMIAAPATADEKKESEGYSKNEVLTAAENFFGKTSQGLADVVEKAFADQGRPNAYVAGEEVSGAIGVGLRYGRGKLHLKSGGGRDVYWQGPSVGFDLGGDASKMFILIYDLKNVDDLFQRFPGGEGTIYVVGGFGVQYLRSGGVALAPITTGVGLRAGLNVNYIHFTKESSWNPF